MTWGNVIFGAIGAAIIVHGYYARQQAIKADEDRTLERYRNGRSTDLIKRGDPGGAGIPEFVFGGLILLVGLFA